MTSEDTTVASLTVSPESRHVLEASIAAGTSGLGLRLLVTALTAATAIALVASLAVAGASAVAGLAGDVGELQKAAFALAFAVPFAISLVFQAGFLRRLRAS